MIFGDPDLKPTAPTITGYTAKQNSPFSQELPVGTGGDGTLSYNATGHPDGLSFNRSSRTMAGTPTEHGSFTVRYTVTDSDGDSDYLVDFTITVDQDFTPTAPDVSNYTGKVDEPFSEELPLGSGGDGTLSYSVTGLLPAGLFFTDSTRTIAGTPTANGLSTLRYTVTDADGDAAYVDFTITIASDLLPTLTDRTGQTYLAKLGSPFSLQLDESPSGDTPLTYTVTGLSPDLSFDDSTLRIEGTPQLATVLNLTYKVEDVDGDAASTTFSIDIKSDLMPTLTDLSSDTYLARVDSPFSLQLDPPSNGDLPFTYTVTGLPPQLSFNDTTLLIKGTPTAVAVHNVTYSVEDIDGDPASTTFTIDVKPDLKPALDDLSSNTYLGKVDSPFSLDLPAGSGGDGNLLPSVTGLPTELSFLAATLRIEGTPKTAEVLNLTYKVADEDGDEVSTTFKIDIKPDLMPTLTDRTGQTYLAKVGSPFSLQLDESPSGDTPLTYTVAGLSPDLSFDNATLRIEGTPQVPTVLNLTYKVEDVDGDVASTTFSIDIKADLMPTLTDLSGETYLARVGSLFSLQLDPPSSGDSPFTYTVTGLPPQLSFSDTTLRIEGTPTAVAVHNVTYSVEDIDGDPASTTFTIDVKPDLKPALDDLSSNTYLGKVDSPFSLDLPAGSGGDGNLLPSVTGLPTELSFLAATLRIEGTPKTAEVLNLTYKVADEDGDEVSTTFKIDVKQDLKPTLDDRTGQTYNGKVGRLFTLQLDEAGNGDEPFTYTVTANPALPAGLTFDDTSHVIAGTPTAAGTPSVTYKVEDVDGDLFSTSFTIAIFDMPSLSETADVMATKDQLFPLDLPMATGGRGDFTYNVTGLPTGLDFDEQAHSITGTPTEIETKDVTITATDLDNDVASDVFEIEVIAGQAELKFPYEIPDMEAKVESPFTLQLPAALGGKGPYTYTSSGLPEALRFISTTRRIEGTPTADRIHSVTYTATDRDLTEISQTFQLEIAADLKPTPPSVDDFNAKLTKQFRKELPAGQNGDPPYRYNVSGLSSGLQFDGNTRLIEGTPDTAGPLNLTYTVTDVDDDVTSADFTITVYAMPRLDPVDDVTKMQDIPFELELPDVTGGRGSFIYSLTGDTLPLGLTFHPVTHTITGAPEELGVARVVYTVTDKDGDQDSVTFKITVSEPDQGVQGGNNQVGNQGGGNQGGGNQGGGNQGGGNKGGGNTQSPPALTLSDTIGFSARVEEQFTQQLPAAKEELLLMSTTSPLWQTFDRGTHTISGTTEARRITYNRRQQWQAAMNDHGQSGVPQIERTTK